MSGDWGWPVGALTQAEAEAIRPVLQDISATAGRRIRLDGLLSSWAYLVREIERGYDDLIDEYMNDLSSRDLLQRIIDSAPVDARENFASALAPIDARFEQMSPGGGSGSRASRRVS